MLDADLLKLRMDELGISQAKLARRVGIKQQSIGRLVSGAAFGSRYLSQIARELKTTPAWLNRETDDPDENALVEEFSGEEREWIDLLRGLDFDDRKAVLRLTRSLATSVKSPSVHDGKADYRGEG